MYKVDALLTKKTTKRVFFPLSLSVVAAFAIIIVSNSFYVRLAIGVSEIILAVILTAILFRVDRARDKLEEQNRERGALLAEAEKSAKAGRLMSDPAPAADNAKSNFLAIMSHEIRTPMNVVLGVAESQLLRGNFSQEVRESFERILDAGHLLLNIINDVLDLSRIEAGRFELKLAKYNVLDLITDAANMGIMQRDYNQNNFALRVEENIPLHLFGDKLRIKQVLVNLLSNAFKYTAKGEVVLSFAAENKGRTEAGTTLVVTVSDTGQGMTAEQVNKLFEANTHFNLEANRTTVGAGLGLAITRSLTGLMNGRISVDSKVGKGTTVTVRIPQRVSRPGFMGRDMAENLRQFRFSTIAREKNKKLVREPMPYGKVLVVDDMKSNLDVARLLLSPYELKIEVAESGFKAIEAIKGGEVYDIILMDHMMPEMDGVETVKNIRELGYPLTIFALTANAIAGQQEFFLLNGFDGFMAKPIDIRQLNDILNRYVRDKQAAWVVEAARKSEYEKYVPDISLEGLSSAEASPTLGAKETSLDIKIQGVDSEAALQLYNGEEDVFISVLRSYINNALNVIHSVRDVSAGSLADYAINVHGLKGISAAICAEKIREMTLSLEEMAKAGDLDGVMTENESFIKEVEAVVSNIKAWLAEYDLLTSKPNLPRPDIDILESLKVSLERYDMDGIDEAMDKLESSNYDQGDSLIIGLREKIDSLEFSEAVAQITTYLEETT